MFLYSAFLNQDIDNHTNNMIKQFTHKFSDILVDPDIGIDVREVSGNINAIHSHFKTLDQGVRIAIQVQCNRSDVGHSVRWSSEFIVRPEVEGFIQAIFDQCVVTVALEVELLVVKGHIVRVTPDLAVSGCC